MAKKKRGLKWSDEPWIRDTLSLGFKLKSATTPQNNDLRRERYVRSINKELQKRGLSAL